jgi:hypothetical protein
MGQSNKLRSIKLSDDLVKAAEAVANEQRRSLGKQIEYWAELGRRIESDPTIAASDVIAIQRATPGSATKGIGPERRALVHRALLNVMTGKIQSQVIGSIAKQGIPSYGVDPTNPERLLRLEANGTRTSGQLINNLFVPDSESAATMRSA